MSTTPTITLAVSLTFPCPSVAALCAYVEATGKAWPNCRNLIASFDADQLAGFAEGFITSQAKRLGCDPRDVLADIVAAEDGAREERAR